MRQRLLAWGAFVTWDVWTDAFYWSRNADYVIDNFVFDVAETTDDAKQFCRTMTLSIRQAEKACKAAARATWGAR